MPRLAPVTSAVRCSLMRSVQSSTNHQSITNQSSICNHHSSMSLILISSDRFAEHQTPPGHPERPERAEVMELIASRWRMRGGEVTAPHVASNEQLARVHTNEYIASIAATAGRAVALDSDTFTSAESHGVALLAAGAGIDAVELVMNPERSKASVIAALAMV